MHYLFSLMLTENSLNITSKGLWRWLWPLSNTNLRDDSNEQSLELMYKFQLSSVCISSHLLLNPWVTVQVPLKIPPLHCAKGGDCSWGFLVYWKENTIEIWIPTHYRAWTTDKYFLIFGFSFSSCKQKRSSMRSLDPMCSDILSVECLGKTAFMGEKVLVIPGGQDDLSNVLCSGPRRPSVPLYLIQKGSLVSCPST